MLFNSVISCYPIFYIPNDTVELPKTTTVCLNPESNNSTVSPPILSECDSKSYLDYELPLPSCPDLFFPFCNRFPSLVVTLKKSDPALTSIILSDDVSLSTTLP